MLVALLLWASPRALAQGNESESGAAPSATSPGAGAVSPVEPVETTTVQAPPPVAVSPAKPVELLDRTAYMVGEHKLLLGLLAFEYGITQQISIGSDPPAWLVGAYLRIIIPNLHLKLQLLDRDPVAVAVTVAGYYGTLNRTDVTGNLLDLPLTLYVSVKVHPRVSLHLEGTYVYAQMFGTGDVTRASLGGAVAARSGQVGLMGQFRVTRIFSLTATGRYEFYTSDLALSGSNTSDPYTTATLSGQYVPAVRHPWEAIAGVAFLWQHFRLTVGAGYGYYFVPGMDVANTRRTFVPDGSIAVVL